jgi:hypothetical protein
VKRTTARPRPLKNEADLNAVREAARAQLAVIQRLPITRTVAAERLEEQRRALEKHANAAVEDFLGRLGRNIADAPDGATLAAVEAAYGRSFWDVLADAIQVSGFFRDENEEVVAEEARLRQLLLEVEAEHRARTADAARRQAEAALAALDAEAA